MLRSVMGAAASRLARLLTPRDDAAAQAMTTESCRARVTVDSLGRALESRVPRDMQAVGSLHVPMTEPPILLVT